ncbi:hypothetical protein BRC90_11100 [Halobacteriales archaeon QS_4_69_34]|nr:MAG: hypothetical protein BRC90_11100 [Halobacteriales archaeon QS_4_69_34]
MDRRQFVAGAASGIVLLAGCLGSGGSTDEATPRPDGSPGSSRRTATSGPVDGPYDEPAATATVGDPSALGENDRPHSIVVWNDAPQARTIGVRLVGAGGDEPVIQRRYDLGSDGYVEWSLALAGYFAIEVAVDGRAFETAAETDPSFVDCNGSSTFVQVTASGDLASTTVSTAAACPADVPNRTVGPEVTTAGDRERVERRAVGSLAGGTT